MGLRNLHIDQVSALVPDSPSQAFTPSQANSVRWVLFFTRFLEQAGYSMFIPCIPTFAKHFGVSPFQMGLVVSLYPLMQFFFNPILGGLSDRWGRRPVLLVCGAGLLLCNATFSVCTDLTVFAIIRALGGVFAVMGTVASSSISDVVSPAERTKGMAFIGAGVSCGFLAGPPLGAFLDSLGHGFPAMGAAVMAAMYLLLLFFRFPETLPPSESRMEVAREPFLSSLAKGGRLVLRSRFLVVCMIMMLAYGMAAVIWEASLGYYIRGEYHAGNERLYGFMLCFAGFVAAVVQLYLLQKMKVYVREVRLIQWAMLGELIGLAVFCVFVDLVLLFAALVLIAAAYAIVSPTTMALISLHSPKRSRGFVMGVASSMSFASKIVAIPLSTALFEVRTLMPFWVATGFAVVALALAMWVAAIQLRRPDREGKAA